MKTLLRRVLDTLLPPGCLACDTPVDDDGQFCLGCFRVANFVSAPMCAQCGAPLPHGGLAGEGGLCPHCAARPPAFTQARAALRYDETAKKLILPFKYADRTEMARGLARLMRRPGARMLAAADVLVPVPLHRLRLRARRYNQAALLARELARLSGRPCVPDGLIRQKHTAPLEGLSVAQRQAELTEAIMLRPGFEVAGLCVLLIDDVMTSGTTADACATALLAAGAGRVDVLTVARVADLRFE
ncbi:ComF family protein [Acidocella aquatica]|nr:ComF family protein [Acidocella aquatica]